MRGSPDVLVRRVRSSRCLAHPVPRVLGVEDGAFHTGHHDGTRLVDLARRPPLARWPDRAPAPWAAWRKTQPGGQIIPRARAAKYAAGAREGAPHAVHVADRWHLRKHLRAALQRFLPRQLARLKQATASRPHCQRLEQTTTARPGAMRSSRSATAVQHNRTTR
jgi:hypothetical protein